MDNPTVGVNVQVEDEKIKSQNITIAIPRQLYNWIAEMAERDELTKTAVILNAVRAARRKEQTHDPSSN